MLSAVDRYVISRENNVVRVDFSREPDPPAPCFPGAGGLHFGETGSGGWEAPPAFILRAAGRVGRGRRSACHRPPR